MNDIIKISAEIHMTLLEELARNHLHFAFNINTTILEEMYKECVEKAMKRYWKKTKSIVE